MNAERETRNAEWLPWLLQTADALFPTGAYAHSLGFEEMVRLGVVRDEATLGEYLLDQILPAQEHHELPYLRFAFAAESLDALCCLDREIDAWKLPHETREASVQLGTRRLAALQSISTDPTLSVFAAAIAAGQARGHHLVIFALQARAGGMPLDVTLATWAYQALAAICAAALKLIRIGQDGCQRALRTAAAQVPTVLERSLAIKRADVGWFNPLLEVASLRHARADERLFIS